MNTIHAPQRGYALKIYIRMLAKDALEHDVRDMVEKHCKVGAIKMFPSKIRSGRKAAVVYTNDGVKAQKASEAINASNEPTHAVVQKNNTFKNVHIVKLSDVSLKYLDKWSEDDIVTVHADYTEC